MCTGATTCVQVTGQLPGVFSLSHDVGSGDLTQITWLGGKPLYSLNHLMSFLSLYFLRQDLKKCILG